MCSCEDFPGTFDEQCDYTLEVSHGMSHGVDQCSYIYVENPVTHVQVYVCESCAQRWAAETVAKLSPSSIVDLLNSCCFRSE